MPTDGLHDQWLFFMEKCEIISLCSGSAGSLPDDPGSSPRTARDAPPNVGARARDDQGTRIVQFRCYELLLAAQGLQSSQPDSSCMTFSGISTRSRTSHGSSLSCSRTSNFLKDAAVSTMRSPQPSFSSIATLLGCFPCRSAKLLRHFVQAYGVGASTATSVPNLSTSRTLAGAMVHFLMCMSFSIVLRLPPSTCGARS